MDTLVVLLFICSFSFLGALGQTIAITPLNFGPDSAEVLARGKAAIQQNPRFLGWKFARESRQDTKKWVRPNRRHEFLPSAEGSYSVVRPPGVTLPTASTNAGFLARPSLPAGFIPTAITSGDFNEDGKMDFAISNGGDNTIYVFLGNGDGTFKVPEILYTQGQSPNWITSVRLHTGGHLDLAVTNGDSNTVEVFPGKGNGTFGASTQVSVPQIPTFVLAADVNKDGNQDLVVGLTIAQNLTQPQFEVLLGDGTGGFSGSLFPPAIFASGDGPAPTAWIAAGDLNDDGYIDMVTTLSGSLAIPYLNQSGKSFLKGNYLGPPNGSANAPLVVELGDMDEDGCLDAIVSDVYSFVSIAKGTCDGNFSTSSPGTPLGDFDPAIKVVDVDGDGHLDVVGSAVWYPNSGGGPGYGMPGGYLVSVLKGDGHGNLSQARVYRGGTSAYSLIVEDFTGDGKPEILTTDSIKDQVSFFLNDGTGSYGSPQGETIGYAGGGLQNAPNSQAPMEVADLNGDGKPDLFLVEDGLDCCSQLTTMLNDGTGKFLPAVRTPITVGDAIPIPIFIAGAFRSPAAPDVIYINTYNGTNSVFDVAFFRGNGDGTFGSPVTITTLPNPQKLVAGDFNGDGKLDFAVLGSDSLDSIGTNWEFDVFLGHGDGTFTELPAQRFSAPGPDGPQQIFAVDLNHDGKLDLLIGLNANTGWVTSGDDLIEVLGNGDGTFQTPTILFSHFGAVAVADVNGDGFPDLIQNRDPNGDFGLNGLLYQPGLTVYLGSPNGAFVEQPSYDFPGVALPSFNPAIVGDFNGDGIADIAMPYWPTPPGELIEPLLIVLEGVGDGTFIVTGHNYQLPALSSPSVGADFNGDGKTDLVDLVGFSSSFTTIPAAPGPVLDITLDSFPILGKTGKATVTLDLPATTAEDVVLSASDPAIQLPASLHFNVGQQAQDAPFTLGSGFDSTYLFALYATVGTQRAVAYGTQPNPNLTVGVSSQLSYPPTPLTSNVSVEPGEDFTIYFGIFSEGGYSGTYSSFHCAGLPAGASCAFNENSLVILPGGRETVAITVNTSSSTPFGTYDIAVNATDGFTPTASTFKLGIGDFSFRISPTTIVSGPIGDAEGTITSSATNGLNEQMSFACTGLPSGTQCRPDNLLYTSGGSTGFGVNHSQLAANDYPFQITATADIVSHTISAVLRVGDFTASLDETTATLSAGQSAMFNVTLTSVNHYASSITVFCQPAASTVSCSASPVPATLTDVGSATVQLTVTNISASARIRRQTLYPRGTIPLWAFLVPLPFLIIKRSGSLIFGLIVVMAAVGAISCGGNGGGSSTGSAGGPPAPQTVNVSVIAQAMSISSDLSNQKLIGPIVITLK